VDEREKENREKVKKMEKHVLFSSPPQKKKKKTEKKRKKIRPVV
jgi:hypothetical protein